MKTYCHPYYYPTQVVMIDDNKSFLNAFCFELEETQPYRLFGFADEALAYIQSDNIEAARSSHILKNAYQSSAHKNKSSQVLSEILNFLSYKKRFNELSVLIVDYYMPTMNGVVFCEQVKQHPAKKIILTGHGDEKIAVDAFNDGLIHRYILKSQYDVAEQVINTINELQHQYFSHHVDVVKESLKDVCFILDTVFIKYFNEITNKQHIVEYYLVPSIGYLMLDKKGNFYLLLVQTNDDVNTHYEVASDQGASSEFLDALTAKTKISYFPTEDGLYRQGADMKNCLFPATKVDGEIPYYCAIVENPNLPHLDSEKIVSYDDFYQDYFSLMYRL